MRPFLSFCVILILFQSLFLGSLVKMELPKNYPDRWEETRLEKQVVLDPFLMPGRDGINQNYQNRNEWVPFHYNNTFIIRNAPVHPMVSEILRNQGIGHINSTIAVYILNGTLRI